ncbi:hypothetical protein ACFXKR_21085 [Streptomyces violascens]|uniref:hypothetical protein n=1 Tax=Streptomyces violascens TaxID=67381 RepID=UPI0036BC21FF
MYEMHVGISVSGAGQVWHVVAQGQRATLCGQPLDLDGGAQTDHHCLACMTAFQHLMQAAEPA